MTLCAAGDADAQYNLGKDIAYDQPREGLELLRSASEQGHFVAQNDLGVMLMRGQGCPGAEPDLVAAEYWFNAAAEQGFHRAMLSMGFLCAERGQPAEALEWLQRAAEQRADPEAVFSLGMCYRYGRLSAEKDLVKAREYLEGAATMGHPRAQLAMGQLVEAEAEGEMWLLRSAEQGNSQAMLSLVHQSAGLDDVHVSVHSKYRNTAPERTPKANASTPLHKVAVKGTPLAVSDIRMLSTKAPVRHHVHTGESPISVITNAPQDRVVVIEKLSSRSSVAYVDGRLSGY